MTFVSLSFILLISFCALLYFLFPLKYRWAVLLAGSMAFYWINCGSLLFVLIGSSLFTYSIGLWISSIYDKEIIEIEKNNAITGTEKKAIRKSYKQKAKAVLWFGVLLDLGALLFYKYADFLGMELSGIIRNFSYKPLNLLKPLGISFYTLQALSYLIDIYRKKYKADRNFFKFLLYMSWFPHIVQGPIARFDRLSEQLFTGHKFNSLQFTCGLQLMLWGWIKKMIIADRIAIPVTKLISTHSYYKGSILFFCAVLYGIQIYTDFSGGMDIAAGFSQALGIGLDINFRQPYFSRSVEEFWRRWHITLGAWMRDYVFYPLSLSKTFIFLGKKSRQIFGSNFGKKLPSFLSMFIVFFLVGFWHGADVKYIVFGLWNGSFIMSGILFTELYEKIRNRLGFSEQTITYRIFQIIRTFVIISFGRFFSFAPGYNEAINMFRNTFKNWNDLSFLLDGTLKNLGLDTANWILLFIALMILFVVDFLHEKGFHIRETISRQHIVFRWIIYWAAIMCILIFGIYGPGYNAASFIYGQF